MADANTVKALLHQDGYWDAEALIENLENSVSRKGERLYLNAFARETSFDDDLYRQQLRCLWTAYCFHHELIVDTAEYDRELYDLWAFMVRCGYPLSQWWKDFDAFDAFMGEYLA